MDQRLWSFCHIQMYTSDLPFRSILVCPGVSADMLQKCDRACQRLHTLVDVLRNGMVPEVVDHCAQRHARLLRKRLQRRAILIESAEKPSSDFGPKQVFPLEWLTAEVRGSDELGRADCKASPRRDGSHVRLAALAARKVVENAPGGRDAPAWQQGRASRPAAPGASAAAAASPARLPARLQITLRQDPIKRYASTHAAPVSALLSRALSSLAQRQAVLQQARWKRTEWRFDTAAHAVAGRG